MSLPGGNALLALAAAALWGGGDFSGGMGVKSAGGGLRAALRVVLLSHTASGIVLCAIGLARGDAFPHGALLAWGLAAGVAGGLSLVAFYAALSAGEMGASAAVSGLLAAAIPVMLSMYADGSPGLRRLAGFAIAAAAIWLIAAGPTAAHGARSTIVLATLAGAGFGVYFFALKMASPGGIVWPMATARMGSLSVCSLVFVVTQLRRGREVDAARGWLPLRSVRWAMSTAVLDTSGNLLFLAATRAGRLDVAAVLASLYPASTILLAAAVLGERPTLRQAMGMGVAVVAVLLIAM